ncbi:MAG: hypothetical protein AAF462_08895 [Thermodesulfobacteriota bacterium]
MVLVNRCFTILILALLTISFSVIAATQSVYAQSCAVEVIKNADPEDNTPFSFTSVVLGSPEDFILTDPDNNSMEVLLGLDESTITENVPEGWTLSSIECEIEQGDEFLIEVSVSGPTVNINCLDSFGRASCVFNNVVAPKNVPTLSHLGMLALAIGIGVIGYFIVRRRAAA